MGRGRRLRPVERIHRAREAESRFGAARRVWDHPPSDPTTPYYGGAAVKAGSGSGEGRTRPTSPGLKPRARPGSGAETRPPTSRGGLGLKNAERAGVIRTRGARAEPSGKARAIRGDAEGLP
jgi:hypothetical protein